MEARKLDPAMWDTVPVESNHGLNIQEQLTKFLTTLWPEFTFGYFIKEDLDHRRNSEGYEVLNEEYWNAVQPWNEKTAFRYGIEVKNGAIMQGDNFVCARPRDYDVRRRNQINREENAKYQAARRGRAAIIKERSPAGVDVGSVLEQTVNVIPPEVFKEPDLPDEDLKGQDVFTNAPKGGKLQVTVNIPEKPEVEVAPKKPRGRPKGSGKKKTA
jgi:hypothetical protein